MSDKSFIATSQQNNNANNNSRGRGNSRGSRRPFRGGYNRGRGRGTLGSSSTAIPTGPSDLPVPPPEAGVPEPALNSYPPPKGCVYPGWSYYFPPAVYAAGNKPPATCVKVLVKYFQARFENYCFDEVIRRGAFDVDLVDLCQDEGVIRGLSNALFNCSPTGDDVRLWLFEHGERGVGEALATIGLAMHHVLDRHYRGDGPDDLRISVAPFVQPRLREHWPITPMRELRTESYGKVVTVRGTIVRVGPIKPVCKRMVYKCDSCGNEFAYRAGVTPVMGGAVRVTLPEKCPKFDKDQPKSTILTEDGKSQACRSKRFSLCLESPGIWLVDGRTIQLQELMSDGEQRQSGRMPRIIEVELESDLINECPTGDVVTVTGLVKVGEPGGSNGGAGGSSGNDGRTKHSLILTALNVGNDKDVPLKRTNGFGIYFTDVDQLAFEELKKEPDVFRLLVHSLCPAIFGHDMVKAALVLALFGGCRKGEATRDRSGSEANSVPTRGDVHVLVVGDPGLGKSQLLKAAVDVAPRGVYVCGNLSTSAGLTVSMNNGGLEAGAVVLSDKGVCCIDEFDKMSKQHEALLEVMEQQTVSVAKAGVVCCVPARATILAAANPRGGHYNPARTVSENLRLSAALLSRFDLVFILIDNPDEAHDVALSRHVLKLRSGRGTGLERLAAARGTIPESLSTPVGDVSLSSRLKLPGLNEPPVDPVPHQIFRKYVAYARANVNPVLTAGAKAALQKFYLELRQNQKSSSDSVPITTRQLESLIRLTEARARLELREEATISDAEQVIELMKCSIVQTHADSYGNVDFRRSVHGSGMSKASEIKRLLQNLGEEADRQGSPVFSEKRLKELITRYSTVDIGTAMRNLNTHGYLLKKGPGMYKLTSTSLDF